MPKKLPIWDQRMLELMEWCIDKEISGIKDQKSFMAILKIPATQTIKQIREGNQSFRHDHFAAAAKKFGVSLDWIYGFSDQMYRPDVRIEPLDLIKEGVRQLEKNKS